MMNKPGTYDSTLLVLSAIALFLSTTTVFAIQEHSDSQRVAAAKGEGPGGVGMEITQDPQSGHFVVSKVRPGTSADKAKILAGYRILEVDGASVDGLIINEVVAKIRGNIGTKVRLLFVNGDKKRKVILSRKPMASSYADPIK